MVKRGGEYRLAIYLVMAADIEQDDLIVGNQQSQGNAVTVGETDSMATRKFAGELMKSKSRLKRVLLQGGDDRRKAGFDVRVLLEKLPCLAKELLRSGNDKHT